MRYFFETYGCQMNKAESAAVQLRLDAKGWTQAANAESAKLVIINTCSVRATAETRIYGRLGWFSALKKQHNFTLILMGCMAERLHDSLLSDFPVLDYVIGTFEKDRIDDIIHHIEKQFIGTSQSKMDIADRDESIYHFASLSWEKGSFQAYVPIMHGCNNFCSYCIVPYVRGRETSRSPDDILAEFDFLSANGVREVTLLGQNVNSYSCTDSDGTHLDFPGLMKKIAERLREIHSGIGWVRFMSSHPKDMSVRLIEVIAEEPVFCRHIHLPIQHGSNEILKTMNRKYTRETYLDLVSRIREKLPDASLSTDILVGFPGESEDDLLKTLDLMNEVKFASAFMYYYNPREGTAAYTFDNPVPDEIKKARLARVIDLQLDITRKVMENRIGTSVTVLVEGISRNSSEELLARTERDERVVFAGPVSLTGTFVNVRIQSLSGNTFRAIINES